jgi:hypothetical protein
MAGIEAFLDICLEPHMREIALRQAPVALGSERWREIEERHALGLIKAQLEALMAAGVIGRRPRRPGGGTAVSSTTRGPYDR